MATISIELEIPDNVVIQSIDGAPESFAVKKVGPRTSSITWKQIIPAGQNAEFKFTAQNPAMGDEIIWRAHQVFEDGTHADWIEPKGSKRPSPITTLKKP
ncbi:MAG: YcnI family protein [Rhodospirillaceae bacterium]|nr:YcnI family protein [Rhodospirillaceae bacterium]